MRLRIAQVIDTIKSKKPYVTATQYER